MSLRWSSGKPLRTLDFDLENRPLTYRGYDRTTAEITAIAASWVGSEHTFCWLLGRDDPVAMLYSFRNLYDEAQMVTGHYIRGHDLTLLNGALLEQGLPPLSSKLTSDTYGDLRKFKDIAKSQEDLAAILGIPEGKVHLTDPDWRRANRLEGDALKLTYARAVGDVRQHKLLRSKLLEKGWLGPPRVWHP